MNTTVVLSTLTLLHSYLSLAHCEILVKLFRVIKYKARDICYKVNEHITKVLRGASKYVYHGTFHVDQ